MSYSAEKTYKVKSRLNWWKEGEPSTDELKLGCLQRIADSLEKMEKPFKDLLEHNEYLKGRLREEQAAGRHLNRRIASLRGAITRMKKKCL